MLLSPFGNLPHTFVLYYYNIDDRILEYGRQVDSKNKKHLILISYSYHLDRVNLHILIEMEQTVLRKNSLLVLFDNIKTRGKIPIDADKGVNFLLCPSCFWCASCLSPDSPFTRCPSCIEGDIESIPIAENENYRFHNDKKRGITMEFLRSV
jgi:hypothetical protein